MHPVTSSCSSQRAIPRSPKGKEPESPVRSEPSFTLTPVDCLGESSTSATRALRGRVSPEIAPPPQPQISKPDEEKEGVLMELAEEFIKYGQLDLALEMTANDLPTTVQEYILESVAEICIEIGGVGQVLDIVSTASLTQMTLWNFLEEATKIFHEHDLLEELFQLIFGLSKISKMEGAILCTVESAIRLSLNRDALDQSIDIVSRTWDLIGHDMQDHFAEKVAQKIIYSDQVMEIIDRLNAEPSNKAKQLIKMKAARRPHASYKLTVIPFRDKKTLPRTESNQLD